MLGVPPNQAPGGALYGNSRSDNVDLNKIQGFQKHNGIPTYYFRQTTYKKFINGMCDKTQDGYTMRSVAEGTHMGGPQWIASNNALPPVPLAGPAPGVQYQYVMTANQIAQCELRNSRLLQILVLMMILMRAPPRARLAERCQRLSN